MDSVKQIHADQPILSLSSFLWEQYGQKSDTTEYGIWSGSQLFAYRMFH